MFGEQNHLGAGTGGIIKRFYLFLHMFKILHNKVSKKPSAKVVLDYNLRDKINFQESTEL